MKATPENFPAVIKKIRREKGWSQKDLADYCAVSKRTVEGWEQGRQPERYVFPLVELVRGLDMN